MNIAIVAFIISLTLFVKDFPTVNGNRLQVSSKLLVVHRKLVFFNMF